MNKPEPLEAATNADLRGSWQALQPAAEQARKIAAQTGTALVIVRNGTLGHIYPRLEPAADKVQEGSQGYGAER
jgi:hypothetical protein